MPRSFAALMRRSTRLMRLNKQSASFRKAQKSVAAVLSSIASTPLSALTSKAARRAPAALVPRLRAAQSTVPERGSRLRIPSGAQYLARSHRSATGSRRFKLYLPASQPIRPKGLIVMLHGCSQDPDDFAIGTNMNALAEKHGLAIAYPAQTKSRTNSASCWNWFRPRHQMRSAGEPAILASLTRKLMREFGLGRDATFVAGLSAGGAMAVILADLYPDIFSAAGVHSGLARGSARGVISAMSAMRRGGAATGVMPGTALRSSPVRRIIFQGAADRTVHPANAAMIVAAALGRDAEPVKVTKRSAGGRDYARSDYAGVDGALLVELWMIDGAGHAWSGGCPAGSFADRNGPDATAHMMRFFLAKSV